MSYSSLAQAMINYVECHLESFDMTQMSGTFGFSESYLRELFSKHVNMPIMQYYRKRRITVSAFEILHSGKKIVDIAFETGFSNHESYTRAFRKVFGMSPNRYRTDRPPMGRKQLDAGVFGLDRLTEKEKRSDVFMNTQKQDSIILYGIRKIEHGAYGSSTMFPICIKAVSEYLGDDVSYASIMAATGAAFRLVWNQADWDLSNIDIYHTLTESNDIYSYGAKALGRAFSFLGRDENTAKEAFTDFIKSNLAKGNPVIALGIIGPPEPCIVAGYDAEEDAVMGWNFFQNDLQFASAATTMDNGYFRCSTWWENTDTQAVMCMGGLTGTPCGDEEILKMAAAAMEAREECTYAKGLRAYDAWRRMLLDEKWFKNNCGFDTLFSRLLVVNDAIGCIGDGRKWAAAYLEELAARYGKAESAHTRDMVQACLSAAAHFRAVSSIAGEMMSLIGDWSDTGKMLQNLASRSVREQLGEKIDSARQEDTGAYEQIKRILQNPIPFLK